MKTLATLLLALFLASQPAQLHPAHHLSTSTRKPPLAVCGSQIPDSVLTRWNDAARARLFVRGCAGAQVVTKSSDVTWVDASGSPCIIYVGEPWNLRVATHELGHCLGFADHVQADTYDCCAKRYIAPRVCDDPSHPAYSPYRGVMSYCDWSGEWNWFGSDDQKMLRAAGYEPTALPSPKAPPPPQPSPSPACR